MQVPLKGAARHVTLTPRLQALIGRRVARLERFSDGVG